MSEAPPKQYSSSLIDIESSTTTRKPAAGIMMPTIEGPGAYSVRIQEAMTGDRLFVHLKEDGLMQPWELVSDASACQRRDAPADAVV